MKSEQLKVKISECEGQRAGLSGKSKMLEARIAWIQAEQSALAWPVSQGDKAASRRHAELDSELSGLRASLEGVNGEAAQLAGELERLRAELDGAQLAELEGARDRAALEEAECLLEVTRLRAQIEGLERQAAGAHERAHTLNLQIHPRGRQVDLGWPPHSDESKARVLAARVDELQRILGG